MFQDAVDKEVKALLELKGQYKQLTGSDFPAAAPRGGGGGGKKEGKAKKPEQPKKQQQQPKEKSAEVCAEMPKLTSCGTVSK